MLQPKLECARLPFRSWAKAFVPPRSSRCLKQPGDRIELDDALCEVETDKAVYPIESSFAGTMGEWKTKVGDTVEIGQELGTILTDDADDLDEQLEAASEVSARERKPSAPVEAISTVLTRASLVARRSRANSVVSFQPICRLMRAGTRFAKRARRRKRAMPRMRRLLQS